MKTLLLSLILLIGTSPLYPVYALQGAEYPVEATLNNVDAIQAMVISQPMEVVQTGRQELRYPLGGGI